MQIIGEVGADAGVEECDSVQCLGGRGGVGWFDLLNFTSDMTPPKEEPYNQVLPHRSSVAPV